MRMQGHWRLDARCSLVGLVALAALGCGIQQPPVEAAAEIVAEAAVVAAADVPPAKPVSLFQADSLGSWKVTNFGGEGEVTVAEGVVTINMGSDLSGITWNAKEAFPATDYQIDLEAQRVEGSDFFLGLTFPVGTEHCSLVLGGWGGGVVGLSSIDGMNASENKTTLYRGFESGRWYRVRLVVTPDAIRCFVDDEKLIDHPRQGHKFSLHPAIVLTKPLGISTFSTTAQFRKMTVQDLPQGAVEADDPPKRTSAPGPG
jgi:hypothetical protein